MAGDLHCCVELGLAMTEGSVVKLKDGRWMRVLRSPYSDEAPSISKERFTEILRCPWCNRKLK